MSIFLFLFAYAALGSAEPKSTPSSSPSANEVAARVQRFYDKTVTFDAGFEQQYTIVSHDRKKTNRGRVVFSKPGKMSFRYAGNANRVVADGRSVKVYEADSKQMLVESMKRNEYPAALAFLIGKGHLTKSFKLVRVPGKELKGKNMFVLEGVPKSKSEAYEKMYLYVDAGTYQVRRVSLLDAQGNRNTFTFEAPAVNRRVNPGEFRFEPPRGTRVIRR